VKSYVEGLSKREVEPFEGSSLLVENVENAINTSPSIERIYGRIKEAGNRKYPSITLDEMLEGSGTSLFTNPGLGVPGFFTKKAWNNFVQDKIEKAAETPGQGNLIGGDTDQASESLGGPEKVRKKLRAKYFEEYVAAWNRFLRNVRYRSFETLDRTAQDLQELGNQYKSPLSYLLARVTKETRFESALSKIKSKAGGKAQEEIGRRVEGAAERKTGVRTDVPSDASSKAKTVHPVTGQMRGVHRLKAGLTRSGKASSDWKNVLEALRNVGRDLSDIQSNRKAYSFAKRVLEEGGGNLESRLSSIRDYLAGIPPNARENLFQKPILDAWSAVMRRTRSYLNRRWRKKVYDPYRKTLKGKYPLSKSRSDARIREYRKFFRPQDGTLAKFVENDLAPLLQRNRRPKSWQGEKIQVSRVTQALEQAEKIRKQLFSGGGFGLQFTLKPGENPPPPSEASAPERVVLSVGGTTLRYGFGPPKEKTFTWRGDRGAQLRLKTERREYVDEFSGAWAWFRLLEDASRVVRRGPTKYRLEWRFAPSSGRYSITFPYVLTSESTFSFNNPEEVLRFNLPKTLD